MIPRRDLLAGRFVAAVRRLGQHKAARVTLRVNMDYGNMWGVAMEWGAGATRKRHAVLIRPFMARCRGWRPSPERMAQQAVRDLAAWGRRKRVMRKRRKG